MTNLLYLFCVLMVGISTVTAAAGPGKLVTTAKDNETVTTSEPDTVEPSTSPEVASTTTSSTTTSTPGTSTTTTTTTASPPIATVTPEERTVSAAPVPVALNYTFPFISRSEWGAREPTERTAMLLSQVPYVVIHDSGEPPMIEVAGCFNVTQCSRSMQNIQNDHMDINGWSDIGYHFAIGGDGAVYEGRGWGIVGAHVKHFNSVSLGICFIGNYGAKIVPTLAQMTALDDLIAAGTRAGLVRTDYRLINHGQIKATLCPGKKLSKKIITLPRYSTFPGSLKDLLDVPEIPDNEKDEIRQELASVSDAV